MGRKRQASKGYGDCQCNEHASNKYPRPADPGRRPESSEHDPPPASVRSFSPTKVPFWRHPRRRRRSSAIVRLLGTRLIAIAFRLRNGPFVAGVFHAMPDHNMPRARRCRFWRLWRRRGRRLEVYGGGGWRYWFWHCSRSSEVIFRYAANWVDFGLCWLTQYKREPSDVCRQ